MAQPFNYMLNVPDPSQAVMGGIQQGVQLGAMMERADLLAAQRRQTDVETAGLQAKADRAKAFQDELAKMTAEGFTAKGLNELMIRYPEAAKQLEAQYTNLGEQERQARVDALLPVAAAVNAGDNVSAQLVLRDQIEALTNSGKTDEAKAASRMLDLITTNPAAAKSTLNLATAGAMGKDKYADTLVKLEGARREEELQPSKVREAAGKAEEAEAKGRLTGKKMEAEISQAKAAAQSSLASAARAAEEAKTERESRQAKVDGLVADAQLKTANAREAVVKAGTAEEKRAAEIDLLKANAEEKRARSKMANFKPATKAFESATSAVDATSGMLSTIDKLEKLINAKAEIGGGTVLDRLTGPISSRIPSTTGAGRDVDALLAQLTAQSFLEKIPTMRGTGPISNTEGERLAAAAGNLTLNQSPRQFRETLAAMKKNAEKIQTEAQQTIAKYNQDYGEAQTPGSGSPSAMSDEALMKALGL